MSSLEVLPTKLPGVLLITPPTVFEDFRGHYVELFNAAAYRQAGVAVDFVQDDLSMSTRHVLRGIHGDTVTHKLVTCLLGRIYLVIVCCDADSPHFGQWESFTISQTNRRQVLAPPRHGVAHLVMSDEAIFYYKQSTYYDPAGQFTYRWDDPRFGIRWPVANPILSARDSDPGR
jgi:dTDP-4-dehydrorhamnose 3,5-epimerase